MADGARGAARGAPARARAPGGGDPPRRRVVHQEPRPRRPARDRRADRGRRRRGGVRAAPRSAAPGEERLRQVASTGDPDAYERVAARRRGGRARRRPDRGDRARPAPARSPPRWAATAGVGHRVRRPRRPPLHRRRARAVLLPDQPGVGVGRERRPARDRPAPGRHGRADRPVQPPPLPGGHDPGGRARAPLRPGDGPDHARHRQLQARQRHLRPPPGRHGAARGRPRPAPVLARDRRAGPLRRRGDGGRAAADRPRGRVPVRRARPAADRGARPAAARRRRDAEGDRLLRRRVARASASGDGKDALVAAADAALYRAKRSGKNRTVRAE